MRLQSSQTRKASSKHSGFSHLRSSHGIQEYLLNKNSLSVLIRTDHSVPVATFMVTYRVGSRNEAPGYTGATHILEHMMFKESKRHPRNFWTTLFNKGAQQNATTWFDRTNYYQTLPSEYLEETIRYEADRMREAIFRKEDLKTELVVVRNEFERGENDPFTVLDKQIWATAFQAHPYHHPTIGWRSDIENATIEKLNKFYGTFYWPNNATLTIIGDIRERDALALVLRYFGHVPPSPHPIPPMLLEEPPQEGPRRVVVSRPGETNIVGIAHKVPSALSKDVYALQALSKILAGGKSSRLYRSLVDAGLATDISIFDFPLRDNGLFIAYAWPTSGTPHERAEKEILREYERVQKGGVTKRELARALAQILSEMTFSRDGSFATAGALNEAIAVGDWTFYATFAERMKRVTPEAVQNAARRYLIERSSITGFFAAEQKSTQPKKK